MDEKEGKAMPSLRRGMVVVTAVLWLTAWPAMVGGPTALADDLEFRWMEVLVRRVEPTFRELHLLDYRSGLSPSGFQVAGSVDLREFQVGDHLLALVGVNNHLTREIYRVPPPTEDKRYQEALRRVLAEGKDLSTSRFDEETEAVNFVALKMLVASELYLRGLTDFLDVLESQRSLYASEDQLVQRERAVAVSLIALHKALGGGWEVWLPTQGTEPSPSLTGPHSSSLSSHPVEASSNR